MIEFITYSTPAEYLGCLYGSEERRNHQLKRDQAVALLLCLTVFFLLDNANLRRLYAPLARIVDLSLILRVLSCLLYFSYYPYGENDGNCSEIVVSRIYSAVLMLGELHQVYFLANFLGLGRMRIWRAKLTTWLNIFSILILLTVLGSVFMRKLLMVKSLWTFLIALCQIYVIRLSRLEAVFKEDSIITGNNTSVRVFEKMSIIQLLPSAFSFVKRLLGAYGIALFGNLVSVPNVMDEVGVLLFYIKVMIIVENADLSIEIVED